LFPVVKLNLILQLLLNGSFTRFNMPKNTGFVKKDVSETWRT
jgi:hypothetical protein